MAGGSPPGPERHKRGLASAGLYQTYVIMEESGPVAISIRLVGVPAAHVVTTTIIERSSTLSDCYSNIVNFQNRPVIISTPKFSAITCCFLDRSLTRLAGLVTVFQGSSSKESDLELSCDTTVIITSMQQCADSQQWHRTGQNIIRNKV